MHPPNLCCLVTSLLLTECPLLPAAFVHVVGASTAPRSLSLPVKVFKAITSVPSLLPHKVMRTGTPLGRVSFFCAYLCLPKFICGSPLPQRAGIWRRAFCRVLVVRVERPHKEDPRELRHPSAPRGHSEKAGSVTQEGGPRCSRASRHVDLSLPAPRTGGTRFCFGAAGAAWMQRSLPAAALELSFGLSFLSFHLTFVSSPSSF